MTYYKVAVYNMFRAENKYASKATNNQSQT